MFLITSPQLLPDVSSFLVYYLDHHPTFLLPQTRFTLYGKTSIVNDLTLQLPEQKLNSVNERHTLENEQYIEHLMIYLAYI